MLKGLFSSLLSHAGQDVCVHDDKCPLNVLYLATNICVGGHNSGFGYNRRCKASLCGAVDCVPIVVVEMMSVANPL
jgi:hypothetical protein